MQETTTGEPTIETSLEQGPVQIAPLYWPNDCGAEAVFLGRTRSETHAKHGQLVRLEYEVYQPMARKLLEQMATKAAGQFGCRAVRLVHSFGAVEPGEASVVVQTATPHRAEAFAACRYLIDRLKHELPIWKHEIWQRGRTVVEGCCAGHAQGGGHTIDEPSADGAA